MSPALRQSWGRIEASPALLRASASAGLPSPPRQAQGAGSCSPVTAPEGLRGTGWGWRRHVPSGMWYPGPAWQGPRGGPEERQEQRG